MAKPQQKRKARPSWFQKQIERNGQDFLLRKSPLDIQREALNIVRDIIRNNVTKRDFEYLFDMKILSNVKQAVYEKYVECNVYKAAITFAMQSPNGATILERNYGVDPNNLQKVFNNNENLFIAYSAILQNIDVLIGFIYSNYPKTEEDYVKIYTSIQYQLSRFGRII